MIVAHRIASVMGFRVPAANGAIVSGMRAAEINLESGQSLGARSLLAIFRTSRMPSGSFHAWALDAGPVQDHWLTILQYIILVFPHNDYLSHQ